MNFNNPNNNNNNNNSTELHWRHCPLWSEIKNPIKEQKPSKAAGLTSSVFLFVCNIGNLRGARLPFRWRCVLRSSFCWCALRTKMAKTKSRTFHCKRGGQWHALISRCCMKRIDTHTHTHLRSFFTIISCWHYPDISNGFPYSFKESRKISFENVKNQSHTVLPYCPNPYLQDK